MAETRWNPEQKTAIESLGGNLLVSAAAGSGKTAVLIERIIRIITDPHDHVDADRLLVVTFTELAAAQMKNKMCDAIAKKIKEDPSNQQYQYQQMLMEKSHVSTIHAFIYHLVLEYFNVVGIAPDSAIGDDETLRMLSSDAVTEAAEKYYAEGDPVFTELVETLSGNSGEGIEPAVLKLYDFIRSMPHYEDWLSEKAEMYSEDIPVSETVWGKIILESVSETIGNALSQARYLLHEAELMESSTYTDILSDDIFVLESLEKSVLSDSWDEIGRKLKDAKFKTTREDKKCDPDYYGLFKSVRDSYKGSGKPASMGTLAKQFSVTEAEFREDIADLYPKIKCLFGLTMEYDRIYSEKKRENHLLDYDDLEQLTLRILCTKDENGKYVRSEAAESISGRFDYILVDECQDVNKVQDTIFEMISNGHNLFFVGDVKQSIYRFRQAKPELFMEKRAKWPKLSDTGTYPATVILGRNYRSRKNITDGVNFIFRQIMNRKSAEMDYTEDEMLVPEACYPESDAVRNSAVIIRSEKDNDTDAEAEWVACSIDDMVRNKMTVTVDDVTRPVKYSDICILLRSVKGRGDKFVSALRRHGISCQSEKSEGFLSRPEVTAVINILRVVDNPLRDIPLCGAMLSEMFSFTLDELSEIRIPGRKLPFYSAVKLAAKNGNEKCRNFVDFLGRMRRYAASESADDVIEKLYSLTSYPQIVRGCEDGEIMESNLRLLVRYAQEHENCGYHGLSSFLTFIDKAKTDKHDLESGAYTGTGANNVHIMTVHGSKGLEFPVVYLCCTRRQFNTGANIDEAVLHPELGFACSRRDPETGYRFRTVPQNALKIRCHEADIAEEMRILYVAMTRARENLVITCSSKDPEKYLASLASGARTEEPAIDPYTVSHAKCEADWLFTSLLRHPDADMLRLIAGIGPECALPDGSRWTFAIEDAKAQTDASMPSETSACAPDPDEKIIEILTERQKWVYPFKASESIPSKAGVSELTHREMHREMLFSAKPSGEKMSAAEKGTAVHKFMQYCNFNNICGNVEDEIKYMIDRKFLSQEEGDAVNRDYIRKFSESSLFERMKSSPWSRREFRFIQSLPAKDLGYEDASEDDLITVQGVADYIFMENGRYCIVDYKTDRVKSMEELRDRYASQLIMYEKLLSASLGVVVDRAVIWSFHLGDSIDV